MHTMFHNSFGLALLCICGLPMVRQSTTAHVWHCKILNAPSNFGDIFARALVAQTRLLLTFPTIRSIIEASLLCDPGLWDYPSLSKALLLHFDKWEILRIFSPIWNRHIHILNPELLDIHNQLVWNDALCPIIPLHLIESFGLWRNES